eukprot:SAG22_NODE_1876_length_3387_cov_3.762470_6_plen_166_part_00
MLGRDEKTPRPEGGRLTLMTANICLPDGTGNTVAPVPISAAGLGLSFAAAAVGLLRHGIAAQRVMALLVICLVCGLPATGVLMRAVHGVFKAFRSCLRGRGRRHGASLGASLLHPEEAPAQCQWAEVETTVAFRGGQQLYQRFAQQPPRRRWHPSAQIAAWHAPR